MARKRKKLPIQRAPSGSNRRPSPILRGNDLYNSKRTIFIACVANIVFSLTSYFYFYIKYDGHPGLCYFSVFISLICAFMAVWPFLQQEVGRKTLFTSLLIQAASLVMLFASIYRGFGLNSSTPFVMDWSLALYFSIVTWTTLGYGDFSPKPEIQLIAALQALTGYVYLGLMVALVGTFVDKGQHQ